MTSADRITRESSVSAEGDGYPIAILLKLEL